MQYLILRNTTYYYRRRIPKSNSFYTASLYTDSLREANKIANIITIKVDALVRDIKLAKIEDELHYILNILDSYRNEALIEYGNLEQKRHKALSHKLDNGNIVDGGHPEVIKHWLNVYRDSVYSCNDSVIDNLYEDLLKRTNFKKTDITPLSKEHKQQFKFRLIKTEAAILQEDLRRAEDRFSPNARQTTNSNQDIVQLLQNLQNITYQAKVPTQPLQSSKTKRLSLAIEEYRAFHINSRKWVEKDTIDRNTNYFKRIMLCFEEDKPMNAYDASDYDLLHKNIQIMPSNWQKCNDLKELTSLKKMMNVVYAKKIKYEPLSSNTINTHIQKLYDFLEWCHSRQYITVIPFRLKDYRLQIEEREDSARKSFDIEDFKNIFEDIGLLARRIYKKEVTAENEEYKIWILLLLIFQGMRLTEAAQLYGDDIYFNEGSDSWLIRIRGDKNRHQRVKSKSAARTIPVNNYLLECGFLEYVKNKDNENIHGLQVTDVVKTRGYGHYAGRMIRNTVFRKVIQDDRKVLHSFRHTIKTLLSSDSPDGYAINKFLGHSDRSNPMDAVYYDKDNQVAIGNMAKRQAGILDSNGSFGKLESDIKKLQERLRQMVEGKRL